jgi:hypothetical protein
MSSLQGKFRPGIRIGTTLAHTEGCKLMGCACFRKTGRHTAHNNSCRCRPLRLMQGHSSLCWLQLEMRRGGATPQHAWHDGGLCLLLCLVRRAPQHRLWRVDTLAVCPCCPPDCNARFFECPTTAHLRASARCAPLFYAAAVPFACLRGVK